MASVYALCPFVDLHRSAAVAYRELVTRAQGRKDEAAVTELRELGPPPYADLLSAMGVHTRWIIEYGGLVRGGPERVAELFGRFESVPGYSRDDYENAAKGQRFSAEHLLEECAGLDLFDLVRALAVPLTVGVGRHDLVNATDVTVAWFDAVSAPAKRLRVFENAAHFPNVCEPEAFAASVLDSMR